MDFQKQKNSPWPHIISLVTSILIGLDIFVFFYLFSFRFIGIVPAIFISFCGFILNTYLYYIDGPENINDFWFSENKSRWSRIFDYISLLGALLIFVFTYYVYAEMILIYPILEFWCTPFLVTMMAFSDSLGTLTMNKSGFLALLNKKYHENESENSIENIFYALKAWFNVFRDFCVDILYNGENKLDINSFYRIFWYVIFPISIGLIVTLAFTRTYLFGALAVAHKSILSFILVPLLWVTAIAFFTGEFYFVCEQNIQLMLSEREPKKENTWPILNFIINMIIAANAVANGFVALEGSVFLLSVWGAIRFIATSLQNYYVIKNKCNHYPGFNKMNQGQTIVILENTAMIMVSLIMVYIAQLPFAHLIFPGSGMLPLLVVLISMTFFFCTAMIGCQYIIPLNLVRVSSDDKQGSNTLETNLPKGKKIESEIDLDDIGLMDGNMLGLKS